MCGARAVNGNDDDIKSPLTMDKLKFFGTQNVEIKETKENKTSGAPSTSKFSVSIPIFFAFH